MIGSRQNHGCLNMRATSKGHSSPMFQDGMKRLHLIKITITITMYIYKILYSK